MTVDIATALTAAERHLSSQDGKRDEYEHRERVHTLTSIGMGAEAIGIQIGLSTRQVQRLRTAPPAPVFLQPPAPDTITDERAAEMEALAGIALILSSRLRDENPALIWQTLNSLSRRRLQELVVVLLAAVPQESTVSELFGWVTDLVPA